MGKDEAAPLVKTQRRGTFTGPCLQDAVTPAIMSFDEADHRFSVSPSPKTGSRRQIFDFAQSSALVRHRANADHPVPFVHRIQSAPTNVTVDHIFLLVTQQQQGETSLPVVSDLLDPEIFPHPLIHNSPNSIKTDKDKKESPNAWSGLSENTAIRLII